jgi:hypothetical protein
LLAATGHRSIVNRGPQHTEYELADNSRFWDRDENAHPMDELGLGRQMATYEFTDAELVDAVDGLLGTAHSAGG